MTLIALDAMGGDFAPRAPVEAALRATREEGCEVTLVGERETLENELRRQGHGGALPIRHAGSFIGMEESPAEALRRKPDASLRVAFEMVRAGEAQGIVSAGHTGALMIAGKLVLGTIEGVDRPAIATHLPHRRGVSILLDSGANVDCKPFYLLQFAKMGTAYARLVLKKERPQVALLNIGSEPGKGNELTRQAFALLESSSLALVGNLEPRELFRGKADVIVCDGFAGNLVLKTAEAAGQQFRLMLKEAGFRSPLGRLGQWLLRGFFRELDQRADYREVGGSLLLGLRGNAIVCHGGSGPRPLQNAIHLAAQCAERGLVAEIAREFGRLQGQASA